MDTCGSHSDGQEQTHSQPLQQPVVASSTQAATQNEQQKNITDTGNNTSNTTGNVANNNGNSSTSNNTNIVNSSNNSSTNVTVSQSQQQQQQQSPSHHSQQQQQIQQQQQLQQIQQQQIQQQMQQQIQQHQIQQQQQQQQQHIQQQISQSISNQQPCSTSIASPSILLCTSSSRMPNQISSPVTTTTLIQSPHTSSPMIQQQNPQIIAAAGNHQAQISQVQVQVPVSAHLNQANTHQHVHQTQQQQHSHQSHMNNLASQMSVSVSQLPQVQVIQQPQATYQLQQLYHSPGQQMFLQPSNLTIQNMQAFQSANGGLQLQLPASGPGQMPISNMSNKTPIVSKGLAISSLSSGTLGASAHQAQMISSIKTGINPNTTQMIKPVMPSHQFTATNSHQIVISPYGTVSMPQHQQTILPANKAMMDQKGKFMLSHGTTIQPKSSILPSNMASQFKAQLSTNQLFTQATNPAQILSSFSGLPQGLTWAPQSLINSNSGPIFIRAPGQSDIGFLQTSTSQIQGMSGNPICVTPNAGTMHVVQTNQPNNSNSGPSMPHSFISSVSTVTTNATSMSTTTSPSLPLATQIQQHTHIAPAPGPTTSTPTAIRPKPLRPANSVATQTAPSASQQKTLDNSMSIKSVKTKTNQKSQGVTKAVGVSTMTQTIPQNASSSQTSDLIVTQVPQTQQNNISSASQSVHIQTPMTVTPNVLTQTQATSQGTQPMIQQPTPSVANSNIQTSQPQQQKQTNDHLNKQLPVKNIKNTSISTTQNVLPKTASIGTFVQTNNNNHNTNNNNKVNNTTQIIPTQNCTAVVTPATLSQDKQQKNINNLNSNNINQVKNNMKDKQLNNSSNLNNSTSITISNKTKVVEKKDAFTEQDVEIMTNCNVDKSHQSHVPSHVNQPISHPSPPPHQNQSQQPQQHINKAVQQKTSNQKNFQQKSTQQQIQQQQQYNSHIGHQQQHQQQQHQQKLQQKSPLQQLQPQQQQKPQVQQQQQKAQSKISTKTEILTHVIDGYIIQESPNPFPVNGEYDPYDINSNKMEFNSVNERNLNNSTQMNRMDLIANTNLNDNNTNNNNTNNNNNNNNNNNITTINGNKINGIKCENCYKTVQSKAKTKKGKKFCSQNCIKQFQSKSTKLGLFNPVKSTLNDFDMNNIERNQSVSPMEIEHINKTNSEVNEGPEIKRMKMTKKVDNAVDSGSSKPDLIDISNKEQTDKLVHNGDDNSSVSSIAGIYIPNGGKNPIKWSVQDVYDFVKNLPGCQEYADEFRSQEIDGQALMLLKEDHLMSAMSMKLGPALKICSKINALREKAES